MPIGKAGVLEGRNATTYHLNNSYRQKELAEFGVNFVQFILIRFWLVKFWIPGLDVAVAYNFLEGNKSFVSCLGILAKNIVMAIVLYIAGIVTFAKRDILRNEK